MSESKSNEDYEVTEEKQAANEAGVSPKSPRNNPMPLMQSISILTPPAIHVLPFTNPSDI